ncbi:unnamed protein product [Lampetra fluviatilis]
MASLRRVRRLAASDGHADTEPAGRVLPIRAQSNARVAAPPPICCSHRERGERNVANAASPDRSSPLAVQALGTKKPSDAAFGRGDIDHRLLGERRSCSGGRQRLAGLAGVVGAAIIPRARVTAIVVEEAEEAEVDEKAEEAVVEEEEEACRLSAPVSGRAHRDSEPESRGAELREKRRRESESGRRSEEVERASPSRRAGEEEEA